MTTASQDLHNLFHLPPDVVEMVSKARSVIIPETKEELIEMAMGGKGAESFEVAYDVPGQGRFVEAVVHKCRNGISVNYTEPYMRRRDPDSMAIADDQPSDKQKFSERFKIPFAELRAGIFDWLKDQDLVLLPFYVGGENLNYEALMIGPANASFFAVALADLQGMIPRSRIRKGFTPKSIVYLAPTFRHSHCDGKQLVVHNRTPDVHEIFSLNFYPGPSAKKGIYGVLLSLGEKEGWITAHGSTVMVTTPYDNECVFLHEGASGSGKSEMLQYPHRQPDGRLLIGENMVTGQKRYIPLFQGCTLNPVTDDMALCHTSIQSSQGRLVVQDAEKGWFVRVDHINRYGVDPYIETLCTNPPEPLVFLNLYSVPKATCLIWEHIEDTPGKPCPNPRVIMPRKIVPGIIDEPVEVSIRSFGVRTPPCTLEKPTYGIIGMLHILPPSLAWLWRLAAPRGHANPSITDSKGLVSEGVGSYWPFATGRRVDQANLLLRQIIDTFKTRYVLIPNQNVGAWKVGFMGQWISREYLSRKGVARFKQHQLDAARCPLLGYAIHSMQIEGFFLNREFLQVDVQPEVGPEGYDKGAKILTDFFKQELSVYLKEKDLDPVGRKIIECCMNDGTIADYEGFIQSNIF